MNVLKTHIHPDIKNLDSSSVVKRLASRALILKGSRILALHTKRYDDYSLPGGGLDHGEGPIEGMLRELREETGATNVQNIKAFGVYEEFRPWNKDGFEVQHMISYCYTCTADEELGPTQHEAYEIKNGMTPLWIELDDAIKHNLNIIKSSQKKGLSVERETFLFESIKKALTVS